MGKNTKDRVGIYIKISIIVALRDKYVFKNFNENRHILLGFQESWSCDFWAYG